METEQVCASVSGGLLLTFAAVLLLLWSAVDTVEVNVINNNGNLCLKNQNLFVKK